jgi:hypothetical protein
MQPSKQSPANQLEGHTDEGWEECQNTRPPGQNGYEQDSLSESDVGTPEHQTAGAKAARNSGLPA